VNNNLKNQPLLVSIRRASEEGKIKKTKWSCK
jgi:hypothetical protein